MRRQFVIAAAWVSFVEVWPREAMAEEPPAEEDEVASSLPEPGTEALGVATFGGDFSVFSSGDWKPRGAPGWNFEIVGRHRESPLFFGLNGGVTYFNLKAHSAIEFRRMELVTRFQPFWGVVRPYIQASIGFGAMLHGKGSTQTPGEREWEQTSLTAVCGLTQGIDWLLYSFPPSTDGTISILLSTGVKRMYAMAAEHPVTQKRDVLALWMPFVSIGLSFDHRHESRRGARRPSPRAPRQLEYRPEPVTIDVEGVKESEPGPVP